MSEYFQHRKTSDILDNSDKSTNPEPFQNFRIYSMHPSIKNPQKAFIKGSNAIMWLGEPSVNHIQAGQSDCWLPIGARGAPFGLVSQLVWQAARLDRQQSSGSGNNNKKEKAKHHQTVYRTEGNRWSAAPWFKDTDISFVLCISTVLARYFGLYMGLKIRKTPSFFGWKPGWVIKLFFFCSVIHVSHSALLLHRVQSPTQPACFPIFHSYPSHPPPPWYSLT